MQKPNATLESNSESDSTKHGETLWCEDAERCQQAGVPEGVRFQTKPEIALEQIRQALEQQVPVGVVLADAGYGKGTQSARNLPDSVCNMQ
jgi:SRSO17 transposase